MGSRGSVIPFFISKSKEKYLPVTDKMTRFMISLEDAVKLVWHSLEFMFGGEIFVKNSINEYIRYSKEVYRQVVK